MWLSGFYLWFYYTRWIFIYPICKIDCDNHIYLSQTKQQIWGGMILDVKYLKYVLAIADRKNMTKAAEELYISQSSLSQFLTKLEQESGSPLFFRAKG